MNCAGQGRPPRAPPPAAAFVVCPYPTGGRAIRHGHPVGGATRGALPSRGGSGDRPRGFPFPSRRRPAGSPLTASLISWPGGSPSWRDADALPSMAPAAAQVATSPVAAAVLRWRRPPPVVASRAPLSADLAVGLMRSAYEVLDGMDVVAMDDFQRSFWLLRSDEWARFREENVGVSQGVLTDVRYFDFISTCQFAAITGALRNSSALSTEKFNAAGDTRVIRRLPAYDDPAERVIAFRHLLGDRLVLLLSSLPTPLREPATLTTLPFIVWAVHDAMTGGGFAVSSIVRPANDDRSVATQWVTPATLWGEAYGAARGDLGHPYDVLAVQALARAAGLGPVRARVRRDDSSLYREYTLVE
ncbi:hypothetical protein MMPV_006562 [Pyropia vietnamensis]